MKKNYLWFRNCLKKAKGTLVSNTSKKSAAVLLSISILSYLVIPIGTVNAETSSSENTTSDSVLYSSIIYGDLNNDRAVDSVDLAQMKMLLLGTTGTDTINTKAADLNGDKNVDALDLALMKQFLLNEITTFPVVNTYVSTKTGSVIDVDISGSFKVSLEENGSTGYLWSYTVSEENAINLISEESFSFSPGAVGAPVQKVWTFEALKPGKYTLLFAYSQPWDKDTAPIETVQCEIYVSTTTGSVINVSKDETFKVSLKEGGFAGYTWSYTSSEENAIALVSEDSFYQHPGWFDAFSQTVWTFKALKPGNYTLLFKRNPVETTVQVDINVQ